MRTKYRDVGITLLSTRKEPQTASLAASRTLINRGEARRAFKYFRRRNLATYEGPWYNRKAVLTKAGVEYFTKEHHRSGADSSESEWAAYAGSDDEEAYWNQR